MKVQEKRSALAQGSQIGVYEVKELTGADRLSLFYSAWNYHLNSPVLLREFFPEAMARRCADGVKVEADSQESSKQFATLLSNFLNEADQLAEIQHEAVANVLNALEFNDTGYQVLSVENGQTLSAWVESAYTFKLEELRKIFETLLGALKAIHDKAVVHGRICPENILLRDNGAPVLINFPGGIFDLALDKSQLSNLLADGYATQEQYDPTHQNDTADDIYALGATLYHCIREEAPKSTVQRLDAIRNGDHDPLVNLSSNFSLTQETSWLNAIDWMLKLEAEDRPQTVPQIETFLAELASEQQKNQQGPNFLQSCWESLQKNAIRTGLAAAAVLLLVIVFMVGGKQEVPLSEGTEVVQIDIEPDEVGPGLREDATSGSDRNAIQSDALSQDQSSISNQSIFESPQSEAVETVTEAAVIDDSVKVPTEQTESTNSELPVKQEELNAELTRFPEREKVALVGTTISKAKLNETPEVKANESAADKFSKIAGYLNEAKENFNNFNLTTPKENNAYSKYQSVLELDPDNKEALSGIKQIEERYTWLIEKAINNGKLRNAGVYLERAEQLPGEIPKLATLRTRLENAP